ncbi:MAG: NapC/NirT family cytochrome c [Gammaproteobacteria bacterium]|nr:NapC/NirT family cytochrome c [Gammaproteobacteria bacterium]MCB1925955.1 NapC/NirT family cytochrome c [Gammaproteobacteria bacterium]
MTEPTHRNEPRKRGFLRRHSPLFLLTIGILAGIVFWGGFNTAMEMTNKMAFCVSCHEMEQKVYHEYKESVHYRNPSGVQATCADCHVPREWVHKVVRKIQATNELYHKVMGTIDTPEKFEAKRWELANRVWDKMRATDSRECRNCHAFDAMELSEQDRSARKKHAAAPEKDQTCIDCHKGIAHEYPNKPEGVEEAADGDAS